MCKNDQVSLVSINICKKLFGSYNGLVQVLKFYILCITVITGFTLCIPRQNIVVSITAWDNLFSCFFS